MNKKRLVYGVGINDNPYPVTRYEINYVNKVKTRKRVWICPYYRRWLGILERCYSEGLHKRFPSYRGCTLSEEWKTFSCFRLWLEKAETSIPEGFTLADLEIDKDIKCGFSEKVYSETTCTLVHPKVNSFLRGIDNKNQQGLPFGVSQPKDHNSKRYTATITDIISGKRRYIGAFYCPNEAHRAWVNAKLEHLSYLKEHGFLWEECVEESIKLKLTNMYSNTM
ncbi:HNH endonuclease [Vibrio phage eugene 12A10]|uniref:HNH endonuclease n=1 Tax=Vibrio phage eugene 12A10 TaxID=573172 RepID=UPI0003514ECF|nr:HNH endonuclease [Vibrio phage eugene 12A10]AGN51459.1 hypothetical protein VPLG_00020 [Vibrio phage eugene 12A10]